VLSHLIEAWASLYANHPALRTGIDFMHVGGLLAGGGCAVTADLATIRVARESPVARATHLQVLQRTHLLVVSGLGALVFSGLLQFTADLETFLHSRVFWLKMGLFALLLANGGLVLRGERQVIRGEPGAWTRLHYAAVASLVLWFLTTLAGTALPNIG